MQQNSERERARALEEHDRREEQERQQRRENNRLAFRQRFVERSTRPVLITEGPPYSHLTQDDLDAYQIYFSRPPHNRSMDHLVASLTNYNLRRPSPEARIAMDRIRTALTGLESVNFQDPDPADPQRWTPR